MENILNKYRNVVASSTDAGPSNSPSATDLQIQMVQYNPDDELTAMETLSSLSQQLMGKRLEILSHHELHIMEKILNASILSIQNMKEFLLKKEIEKSKQREDRITKENEALREELEELKQKLNPSCSSESNSLKRMRLMCDDQDRIAGKQVELEDDIE
ncbi:agamous-like MADS-box protein AGL15 [Spinacia oleracea]|uniref:Agamous-like MADS-box protein AGL15 n=1 Tax=Spinacia oleracea TaxID=3562 RepID=A0A9R0JLK6_SPIOL|nr:agamous-like MADS-box protein AGL15 [Spinacia oleracea]